MNPLYIFLVFYLLVNYSTVHSETTDRHFNLIDKFHCTFDCHNATFADCSANGESVLIYIINSEKEAYNFETTHLKDLKNIDVDIDKTKLQEVWPKYLQRNDVFNVDKIETICEDKVNLVLDNGDVLLEVPNKSFTPVF